MQSGAQIGIPLTGHSHDEKTLATALSDQTVRFWDLKTGRFPATVYIWDMKAASNDQNRPEVTKEQGNAEQRPKATREEDRKSETSSTRRRLDMLAVGFPVARVGAEASYYDREGYDRHVAAADPSQRANAPPQPETTPGNYATHAVLPPSPPHTPTDLRYRRQQPNEHPDEHKTAEIHRRTNDDTTSVTTTSSTRLAINTPNARERTERARTKHRSAHDTAIETERLRTEAQEKEAAASRAYDLLVLARDSQIELVHIHAAHPAHVPLTAKYYFLMFFD
ncbi:hypothetical protein PAXINDRAFT_102831 [Paxillus involutus ATCC 200175]|uniref:Uncharacterized protein n=1 Tax=Paxillus involutus ATCC 200175 TaxID=664439 RepID=A0A0C9T9G8_PAXIN|nr:hypothetical protein PAXINDRAFT_102831 [Paxillus involutus ATCC 200175]